MIGFERTVFTVNEGSTVSLVAEVMEGVVTQTVVVSLSTEDGTAACERVLCVEMLLVWDHECVCVGVCAIESGV